MRRMSAGRDPSVARSAREAGGPDDDPPSPKTSPRGQADADDDAKDDGATADAPTRHPGDDEPEELLCPITKAMMRDPVFVAGSGNTYEREAIETFWRGRGPRRDPLTNQELANAAMYTNWDKRREVAAWLSRHPNRIPEGWPDRDVPPPADERGDRGRRRPATIVPRELDDLVRRPVAVAAATFAAVAAIAVAFVASTTPAGALPVPSARGAVASFDPIGVTASRGFGSSFGRSVWFSSAAPRDHPEKISAAAPAGDRTRDPDVAALERFAALADDMRAARAPSGSRVLARRGPDGALEIIVPPLGLLNPKSLAELGFAAVWSAFTGAWTFGAARGPAPAFALFSLPFWGVGAHLGKVTACAALETTRLVLVPPESPPSTRSRRRRSSADADEDEEDDGGRFFVAWEALGRTIGVASGALRDVTGAEVVTLAYVNGVPQTALELREGVRSHAVGRGLHRAEQEFVVRLVEDALAEAGYRRYDERRGRDGSFARSRL